MLGGFGLSGDWFGFGFGLREVMCRVWACIRGCVLCLWLALRGVSVWVCSWTKWVCVGFRLDSIRRL